MFNKWKKTKSYLFNKLGELPMGGGFSPSPVATIFMAIGAVFNFLAKPAVQLGLFVAQGVSAHKAAMKAKRTGAEILLQKYGTGAGMPVIYGTRRVAGTVVYMNTTNNKELFVVYAIAGHEIDSFDLESLQIDGRTIKDTKIYRQGYDISDGSTRINFRPSGETRASGTFWGNTSTERANITGGANTGDNARMTFNCHKGTTTQAADPMLEGIISEWTSNHKLTGITYIAANYEYDIQGMFTGIPNLTVVVNGKKVYDLRTATTGFSSNPALCLLDYLTDNEYGKGLSLSDDIDSSSFSTAANDCDTSADTITHSSIVVENANTNTDRLIIANANEDDYNNFKVGNKFTISDGVTTYVSDKKLIDKDTSLIDIDGTNPVATLQLTFETGAVGTAITSNTACTFTETQIRFDCNGVLDTDETVLENTKLLVANMRGIFTYTNGKYSIKVEGTESSVVSLDEDDILESGITLSLENKEAKYNKVEAEFYNAQKKYETDTTYYTGETSDTFLSDDGNEVLETRIQLPFCTNQRIAYNHAKAMLKRSRSQKTISFVATPKILKAKVGEVISVTNSNLNLSSEQYRITNMVINPDLNISVNAIEYQTAIYGYVTPPNEEIGIGQDPVIGNRVEAPSSLTFTNKNSTTGEAAKLTWTDSTKYPSYEFRVQIVDTGGKTRYDRRVQDTYFYLDGISVANGYTAKVSAINTLGIESATTDINVNVTTAPVTTPDIEQGSIGGFNFTATKMYYGTAGNFNNTDTAVYFDNAGQFSLKDKLSWNGTTLNISGNLTVENTITADKITLGGTALDSIFSYNGVTTNLSLGGSLTVSGDISNFGATAEFGTVTVSDVIQIASDLSPSTTTNALYNQSGTLYWNGNQVGVGAINSVTNMADNRVLTASGSNSVNGEANLTFDGSTLDVNGNINITEFIKHRGDADTYLQFTDDDISLFAGGVEFISMNEATEDTITLHQNTTASGNLIVTGDLTVNGLTTSINTTDLNVEDKNITLNYSTGDSSASANGAGITIQDAVNSTTDATILWDATNDEFDFSHTVNITGGLSLSADATFNDDVTFELAGASITVDHGNDKMRFDDNVKATFGNSDDLQIFHNSSNNHSVIQELGTGDLRIAADNLIIFNQAVNETKASFLTDGSVRLFHNNVKKFETTSTGIDVTGTVVSDGLTSSGLLTVGSGAGAIKINESYVKARSSDNANDINLIANINVFDADDVVIGSTTGERFNDNIVFRTNGSQALRIDSSQTTTFSSSITIGSGGGYSAGSIFSDSNWGMIFRAKQASPNNADFLFSDSTDTHIARLDQSYGLRIYEGGLAIDTTTVIDSSRNLTNIGTISSGAITSSGQVSASELNITNDATLENGADFQGDATFGDNDKAIFGASNDLRIFHDGNNSVITHDGTGNLFIRNTTDDADIKFQTDDGSGGQTDYFRLDGDLVKTIFSKDTRHNDSVKALFGTSSDLEIYHDGSHSYISDSGTGNLYIRGGNTIDLRRYANGEQYLTAVANGAVTLFYDGSSKLATTSTGIDVTGTIEGDTRLNINNSTGYGSIELGGSSGGFIDLKTPFSDDKDARIIYNGNNLQILTNVEQPILLRHNNSTKLATTSTGIDVTGVTTSSGSINTTAGGYQINGVTVINSSRQLRNITAMRIGATEIIDSSRNLTNIGTISSGSHTSTGDVGFAVNSGGNAYMVIDRSASNRRGALVFSTGATDVTASPPATATVDWSLGVSDSDEVSGDKFYIRQGTTDASGSALLIDSSNNATFAGDITSSGDIRAVDVNISGSIQNTVVPAEASVKINENGYADGTTYFRDLDIFNGKGNQFVKFDGSTQRVGIGTTAPEKELDVLGTLRAIDSSSNQHQLRPTQLIAYGTDAIINAQSTGNDVLLRTQGNTRLIATAEGSVGIGTSSPAQKLHVEGNLRLQSTFPKLEFVDTDNNPDFTIIGGSGRLGFYDETNSSERLRIDSSGRLLVGKTAVDNTTVGFRFDGASGFASFVRDGGEPLYLNRKTSNGDVVKIAKDGTVVGVIGTQNWGIGTSSPLMKLHVNTSGTSGLTGVANRGMIITDSVGARLVLEDTGATSNRKNFMLRSESDAFTISGLNDTGTAFTTENMFVITGSSGDVGIGKVNPAQKLDVQGNFGIGGTQVIDSSRNLTNIGTISASQSLSLNASGTNNTSIEIGANTASNHYAFIDLVGDTTYSDYGLRIIRNNGGANTSSFIYHRGTGNFNIETQDSASLKLRTAGADALSIDTSQRVGIGTTSPDSLLHLETSTNPTLSFYRNDGSILINNGIGMIQFGGSDSGDTNDAAIIRAQAEGGWGASSCPTRLSFWTTPTGSTSATERLRIDKDGNVGIGTTSPQSRLDLGSGSSSGGGISFGTTLTEIRRGGTNGDTLQTSHWGNVAVLIDSDNNDSSTRAFKVMEGNTDAGTANELFRVRSDGRVGIGTTSPSRQLTLQNSGNALAKLESTGANYVGIDFENTSRLWYAGIRTELGHSFGIKDEDANRVRLAIDLSGNVDIPQGNFEIGGQTVITSARALTNIASISSGAITSSGNVTANGGTLTASSTGGATLTLEDSGSHLFRIVAENNVNSLNFKEGGNNTIMSLEGSNRRVGIGTTSPSQKLDVAGKIRASQDITITNGDLIVNTESKGIRMLSANGTEYLVFVNNSGQLVVEEQ